VAHANFHIAAGIAVGTAATALPVLRAWHAGRPVARPIARLLVASYALGFWAVVPAALTTLGAPAAVHHAWWADVFLLHAQIDRRIERGLLIGELAIAAAFVAHYLLVLVALRRARRQTPSLRSASTS
jgi:hypothetical protein